MQSFTIHSPFFKNCPPTASLKMTHRPPEGNYFELMKNTAKILFAVKNTHLLHHKNLTAVLSAICINNTLFSTWKIISYTSHVAEKCPFDSEK